MARKSEPLPCAGCGEDMYDDHKRLYCAECLLLDVDLQVDEDEDELDL